MAPCMFRRQRDTRATPPWPAEVARAALAQHGSLTREEVFCLPGTHSTAGSHLPWKKVAGQMEGLHEPAPAWTTLGSTGNPLTCWGEGSNIIPVLPQDQNQNMKFIHRRSPLVPRLLTSWLSSPSFLNMLLSHSFHGLLLIFYCSTRLKVWRCWVLVSFQDCSPLSSLLCCWDGWALRNILYQRRNYSLVYTKSGIRLKVCNCCTEEGNFLHWLLGEYS